MKNNSQCCLLCLWRKNCSRTYSIKIKATAKHLFESGCSSDHFSAGPWTLMLYHQKLLAINTGLTSFYNFIKTATLHTSQLSFLWNICSTKAKNPLLRQKSIVRSDLQLYEKQLNTYGGQQFSEGLKCILLFSNFVMPFRNFFFYIT